jgi:hypothetical protein
MVRLAAGTAAARSRRPEVSITLLDYDPEGSHEALCQVESYTFASPRGHVEGLRLVGIGAEAADECEIAFSYEVVEGELPQRADHSCLLLRHIHVVDVPDADQGRSLPDPYLKVTMRSEPNPPSEAAPTTALPTPHEPTTLSH